MDKILSPSPAVRCLLQSVAAHPALEAGLPPDGLLAPIERTRWEQFKVAKRRRDWLMGRWTAKHLVQEHLALNYGARTALDAIVIDADPDGAPYAALIENGGLRRLDLSLSISHTGQLAFCALCAQPGLAVGADVERVEAREPSFAKTFFSASEEDALRNAPAEARDLLTAAIWSGKEAVLKALRIGLRADTRRVQCCVRGSEHLFTAWEPMAITLDAPLALPGPFSPAGWWRATDGGHEGSRHEWGRHTWRRHEWRSVGVHVLVLALLSVPPPQVVSQGPALNTQSTECLTS